MYCQTEYMYEKSTPGFRHLFHWSAVAFSAELVKKTQGRHDRTMTSRSGNAPVVDNRCAAHPVPPYHYVLQDVRTKVPETEHHITSTTAEKQIAVDRERRADVSVFLAANPQKKKAKRETATNNTNNPSYIVKSKEKRQRL